MSKKIYWTNKEESLVWTHCPKCGRLAIVAKEVGYEPKQEEIKHLKAVSEALFIPKKLDGLSRGCNLGKWSRHINIIEFKSNIKDRCLI